MLFFAVPHRTSPLLQYTRTMTATDTRAVKFTYSDLEHFPNDGKRRELIHGALLVTPAPSPKHQRLVKRLLVEIELFLRTNPLGEVFVAPLDVIFSDDEVVQPDLMFVSNERAGIVTARGLEGPPDWVIEVLSPSTRAYDLEAKRKLCQSQGIETYWAIDQEKRVVHVWDGAVSRNTQHDETIIVSSLPGFQIALSDLLD
jgi:Uma2 family endonuclease